MVITSISNFPSVVHGGRIRVARCHVLLIVESAGEVVML